MTIGIQPHPAALPAPTPEVEKPPAHDQRVFLHNVSWADYERLLEIKGDESCPRITYLEGEVELMSPSINHEVVKKFIARLLEGYADERGLDLNGYGSWTVRKQLRERGVEPDECYVLGTHVPERPDLAIEVIWTHGGLDKLEVYRGLGVPEVWMWEGSQINVHALNLSTEQYQLAERSVFLPELDLALLASFLGHASQTQAVREYRAALRGGRSATGS